MVGQDYKGLRVAVIGAGESGSDICNEVGRHADRARTPRAVMEAQIEMMLMVVVVVACGVVVLIVIRSRSTRPRRAS